MSGVVARTVAVEITGVDRMVMTVPEVAEVLDSSPWAVYESIKRGDFPVQPIRIGRKILFARSKIEQLLGLKKEEAS